MIRKVSFNFSIILLVVVGLLLMSVLIVTAQDALDYTLPTIYGSTTINEGLQGQTVTAANVVSGGYIDIEQHLSGCEGYVMDAPDFEVYVDNITHLVIYWMSTDGGDGTLVVNGVNGEWYCDDDSAGNLNPRVNIPISGSGVVDIWVGSYYEGEGSHGTLLLSNNDPPVSIDPGYMTFYEHDDFTGRRDVVDFGNYQQGAHIPLYNTEGEVSAVTICVPNDFIIELDIGCGSGPWYSPTICAAGETRRLVGRGNGECFSLNKHQLEAQNVPNDRIRGVSIRQQVIRVD